MKDPQVKSMENHMHIIRIIDSLAKKNKGLFRLVDVKKESGLHTKTVERWFKKYKKDKLIIPVEMRGKGNSVFYNFNMKKFKKYVGLGDMWFKRQLLDHLYGLRIYDDLTVKRLKVLLKKETSEYYQKNKEWIDGFSSK